MALRMAGEGYQVIGMEPMGRSDKLRRAVGSEDGCAYHVLAETPAVNILDPISTDPAEQFHKVVRDIEIALGKLVTVGDRDMVKLRELTNAERTALDAALRTLYGDQGERLPTLTVQTAPLLSDLVRALRAVDDELAPRLANEIAGVLLGMQRAVFGRRTTLPTSFDRDITLYNFNGVDKGVMPIIYDHLYSHVLRYVRTRTKQRGLFLMIDEAWYMSQVAALQDLIVAGIKLGRNLGMGTWVFDQNIDTFFNDDGKPTRWGAFILDNAAIRLFFRNDGTAGETIERAFKGVMEPRHLARIQTLQRGEYVGAFGDTVRYAQFNLLPMEKLYFAGGPNETAHIHQGRRDGRVAGLRRPLRGGAA
jgi:hypothetical protein